jgi:hypothetical protein
MNELLNCRTEYNEPNGGNLRVQKINQEKYDKINELHKTKESELSLVPSEVQSNVLCSNNSFSLCTSLGGKNTEFIELAKIFKGIHLRMKALGHKIHDGKVLKKYEKNNNTRT